eukprot:TRINITY_DN5494_c0_g1_i4.p1 TRINITY_DN5494_c0_g1~~TRINITY_DN5494_c0_g1_i4.p1  ORF type:complete len:276 (+),score=38.43 TRINITY_DN5494_c0_g1_i4:230-1057(+)
MTSVSGRHCLSTVLESSWPSGWMDLSGCCLRTSCKVTDSGANGFAGLGMMLVHPSCRGQGVARQLLTAFRLRAEELNQTCMLACATELGHPVYLKYGYKAVPSNAICAKMSASCTVAATLATPEGVTVATYKEPDMVTANLSYLLSLDQEATGFDRTEVLTNLSRDDSAMLSLAWQGRDVIGACLTTIDSQTGALNVGPLLGTEGAANALIRDVAHQFPERSIGIFCSHVDYMETLQKAAFTPVVRMVGLMVLADMAEMVGDRSKYLGLIQPALG